MINWKDFWKRFDTRVDTLKNMDWDGSGGQKAMLRKMLGEHDIVFTTSQWRKLNARFEEWFSSKPRLPEWDAQKRWLQTNILKELGE